MRHVLVPLAIVVILILIYVGPFVFVYARTATWTFPRIDERDAGAFDTVEPSVSQVVNLEKIENVGEAQEVSYSLESGVLHRKFLDWIGFPLVLEVNDFNFKATGIYQGEIIFHCRHFETAFPRPTGTEPWYIYQPLVDRNDNTTVNVSCHSDVGSINPASFTAPITLDWSMSANFVGDRNERELSWSDSQSIEIRDVRSSGNQEEAAAEAL
jgi:hypothetical protein